MIYLQVQCISTNLGLFSFVLKIKRLKNFHYKNQSCGNNTLHLFGLSQKPLIKLYFISNIQMYVLYKSNDQTMIHVLLLDY